MENGWSLKHQKHVASHANAGCDALSHSTVCLSLLLIDHAHFYGEDLLDGTKMEPCPMTGDRQGMDVSVTDWLTFPSLPPSLLLHPLKATLVPELPLLRLSSAAGRTPRLGCRKDTGSSGAKLKPPASP